MNVHDAVRELAKLQQADEAVMERFITDMEAATGRSGMAAHILARRDALLSDRLVRLGIKSSDPSRMAAVQALEAKVKSANVAIHKMLGQPHYSDPTAYPRIFDLIRKMGADRTVYALKKERAAALVRSTPPQKLINALGYGGPDELLQKEDVADIFSAIRIFEDREWLDEKFLGQYSLLTTDDFEERPLEMIALDEHWYQSMSAMLGEGYRNISHLKELGVIFVAPWKLGEEGESVQVLAHILHYMHEIAFFSDLFQEASSVTGFGSRIVELLRGKNTTVPPAKNAYPIHTHHRSGGEVQARPHLSAEALHWSGAQADIANLSAAYNLPELSFWQDIDWVAQIFHVDGAKEEAVSFHIMDVARMGASAQVGQLYHGSLWNHIFGEFIGHEELPLVMKRNYLQGFYIIET